MKTGYKFLRESTILLDRSMVEIEVWEETNSKKLWILNKITREKISLNGAMGEEV